MPRRLPSPFAAYLARLTPCDRSALGLLRENPPRPREWQQLPPGHPYECRPGEAKRIGTPIPGRRGGAITACATPTKKRPDEGAWWVGAFSIGADGKPIPAIGGRAISKYTAKNRLKAERRGTQRFDLTDVAISVGHAARDDRHHIPAPTGAPYPHRPGSSVCDLESRAWQGYKTAYDDALETARERVALEHPDADEFEATRLEQRYLRKQLEQHPDFNAWSETERLCVASFKQHHTRSQRETAAGETLARRRQLALSGADLSDAEYLDTLTLGGQARHWRRIYNLSGKTNEDAHRRALELERRQRAKKRGPLKTFRQ